MIALFELTTEYRLFAEQIDLFCEQIDSGEIPEEVFWDTLEAMQGEINSKLDNVACIYKQMMYEAAMMKAEELKLCERRKAKEAAAERMKEYIRYSMQAVGMKKLETARNRLSFRSSTRVKIDDEDAFVEWAQAYNPDLLTYKTPAPNKTAIGKVIKSGQPVQGCTLEQGISLQVK